LRLFVFSFVDRVVVVVVAVAVAVAVDVVDLIVLEESTEAVWEIDGGGARGDGGGGPSIARR